MHASVNPGQRYIPSASGITDRFSTMTLRGPRPAEGIVHECNHGRDYTAVEKLDTCAWLNDREAGYPLGTKIGATKLSAD
jgi:hypothetical protein